MADSGIGDRRGMFRLHAQLPSAEYLSEWARRAMPRGERLLIETDTTRYTLIGQDGCVCAPGNSSYSGMPEGYVRIFRWHGDKKVEGGTWVEIFAKRFGAMPLTYNDGVALRSAPAVSPATPPTEPALITEPPAAPTTAPAEPARTSEPPPLVEASSSLSTADPMATPPEMKRAIVAGFIESTLDNWIKNRIVTGELARRVRESIIGLFRTWGEDARPLLEKIRAEGGPRSFSAHEMLVIVHGYRGSPPQRNVTAHKAERNVQNSVPSVATGEIATAMRQVLGGTATNADLVTYVQKEFGRARDAMASLDERRAANLFLVRVADIVTPTNPTAKRAGDLMQLVGTLTEKPAYAICAALLALEAASLYRKNIPTVSRNKAPKLTAHADDAVARAKKFLTGIDPARTLLYTPAFAAVIEELRVSQHEVAVVTPAPVAPPVPESAAPVAPLPPKTVTSLTYPPAWILRQFPTTAMVEFVATQPYYPLYEADFVDSVTLSPFSLTIRRNGRTLFNGSIQRIEDIPRLCEGDVVRCTVSGAIDEDGLELLENAATYHGRYEIQHFIPCSISYTPPYEVSEWWEFKPDLDETIITGLKGVLGVFSDKEEVIICNGRRLVAVILGGANIYYRGSCNNPIVFDMYYDCGYGTQWSSHVFAVYMSRNYGLRERVREVFAQHGTQLPGPDGTGPNGRGAPAGGQTTSSAHGAPVPASGSPGGAPTQALASVPRLGTSASIFARGGR